MPRTPTSQTGQIVQFFRTASLEAATLVLDLCKEEVRIRKQKSTDAKARATQAGAGETTTTPKKKAAPKRKKKAVRRRGAPATPEQETMGEAEGTLFDTAEAGDLAQP